MYGEVAVSGISPFVTVFPGLFVNIYLNSSGEFTFVHDIVAVVI